MRVRIRRRFPELALGSGLLLLAVGFVIWSGRPGPSHDAPPQVTTATTPAKPRPALAPAVLAIDHVEVVAGPFSATVRWRTSRPTRSFLAYGVPALGPTLWVRPTSGRVHEATLGGLTPARSYRIWISASTSARRIGAEIEFTTALVQGSPATDIEGGRVRIAGEPFFPLMTFGPCAQEYETALSIGINFFMENSCGGVEVMVGTLAGRALSAAPAAEAGAAGDGLVGWYHPDEADVGYSGRLGEPNAPPPGRIGLLTLSNHVFSGAGQLAAGRAIYPRLVRQADVVGFDLYPLQEFCDRARLRQVYDAQRELVALAGSRPTFQWIEDGTMKCTNPGTAVTPEIVAVESWLAILGGARGLGFFPSGWPADMQAAVGSVTSQVRALAPALLSPARAVDVQGTEAVLASARIVDGALYVFAVNPTDARANARLVHPALRGRVLTELGSGGRRLAAARGELRDTFPPLSVRLYVAPPPWES